MTGGAQKISGGGVTLTALAPGLRWLFGFSVVGNLLILIIPIYMTEVYDRVLPSRSEPTLIYLTLIAVAGLALFGVVESVRQSLAQKLSASYELAAMPALIHAAVAGDGSGEAAGAAAQVAVVRRFLASSAFTGLFDLPFAPLFLLLMFLAHPLIGLTTIFGMAALAVVTMLNLRMAGRFSDRIAAAQARTARQAGDAIRRSEDIRSMGMGDHMAARWRRSALTSTLLADEVGEVNARFYGVSRCVRQALQVLVLGVGAWLVISGRMSPSLIFAASIISSRALMPVEQLVGAWRQIGEALHAHRRIDALLAASGQGSDSRPAVTLPSPKGRLEASGLYYAPSGRAGEPPLLRNVALVCEPGRITAIVGASGSGKSTLARLLAGAVTPSSGEVTLDRFPFAQWPAAQRGAAFGYLAQDATMLEGTVAENISRFDPDALDAAIISAAGRAGAHALIATLPDGYNTLVGPGGVRLSGGQSQRIALARALYGEPSALVLDEPNVHLDADGEETLLAVLKAERGRGRTIVVVTHRSNVLAIADHVYKLDGGRLSLLVPLRRAPNSPLGLAQAATA